MTTDIQRKLYSTWRGPRAVCTCEHLGDGSDSEHQDNLEEGHGACRVKGCKCARFVWAGFTDKFNAAFVKAGVS